MSSIEEWLERQGLAKHVALFAEHAIDLDVLGDLTADDLKDLGIPLGDRKRLLKALAREGKPQPSEDAIAPASRATPQAERRQLTVLFCDLVGSTALTQQVDPERLRELLRAYQQACGAVAEKYDGHVAQYLGDGLMVYFGWPRAHEDDAERAVRAGLEMVAAVKPVPAPSAFQVRVGIATGSVVVGETGAGDAAVPKLAVGETPNIAARLQALAGPDEIVVAPSTRRLLGALFAYRDLGEHVLKGIVEPVRAWCVTTLLLSEGRFEAAREMGALTRLVGRDTEMRVLFDRWRLACQGEGQLVLLCGEPGIGKSRCMRMLRQRIEGESYLRLVYQCSPFHMGVALHPFIDEIERSAGFRREDSVADKLAKLEALLHRAGISSDDIALVSDILPLPSDRYPLSRLSPQEHKGRTLDALVRYILGLAGEQPVLIAFEDLHWADPTTLEALDILVSRIEAAAVLIVVSHRPEFSPRWAGQPHVLALTLARLSRREAESMAQGVTAGKALPPEVVDHIVSKTDGIPLFVEEMTKALVESGLLREAEDRYELAAPLVGLAVPSTLQGSLMSRLDRAPLVREVAQVGACIGRNFGYGLLAAMSALPASELQAALDALVDAELLFRRGSSTDATYRFKHALVQDAAYDSILRSRRQTLHEMIAQALEQDPARYGEAEPQVLAMHFERAGLVQQALAWHLKAGESAKARSANREAIQSLERALHLLGQVGESEERNWAEAGVRANLGMLHMSLEGWTSRAARTEFAQAEKLTAGYRRDARRFAVLVGLVESLTWELRMAEASSLAEELVELAERSNERVHALFALQVHSRITMYRGRFREALEGALRVAEQYDEGRDAGLAFEYGYDPAVFAMSTVAYTYRELGYLEQGLHWLERCVALARRCGHPYTLSFALSTPGADMCYLLRRPDLVLRFAREGSELAHQGNFPYQQGVCDLHEGWAIAMLGRSAEGRERMTAALDNMRRLGVRALVAPRMTAQLASVCGMSGDADEGLRVLASSPDRQPGQRRVRYSEIFRIEGDLHLQKRRPDEQAAEACYREAIAIAIEDQAKPFELRACTSLARLWQKQGRHREAYQLVAPVYVWFTEGFDYPDLYEAKTLLDELLSQQPGVAPVTPTNQTQGAGSRRTA